MARKAVRIGLVIGYGLDYYRDILRGIKSFAEARPHWVFTPIAPEARAVESLRPLDHDGLIVQVVDRRLAGVLLRHGKPMVNVSGVLPELPIPRVGVDHALAGRLAGEHLLDRGLRHFGFVGYPRHAFSTGRERGFREAVERAGFGVDAHYQAESIRWETSGLWTWDQALQRWLARLPKPVGLFASHDLQGVQLSEACRRAGLRVPDEVALIGVDNDDLLCELARPSLSSVALPAERIGHEAARLLDDLLHRRGARAAAARTPPAVLLPPTGVVARGSSDILAIADRAVAAGIRYIREQAHQPIQVDDVAREAHVSRRSLERRFRAVLGRTVWEEIRRAHLERAKALLSGTEMPMAQVAENAGLSEAKQLSVVVREETGMTPTEYRRRFRSRV